MARGRQEALAEHRRPQGIVLLDQCPAQQRTEAGGELVKGEAVAVERLVDHCLNGQVALGPVIQRRRAGIGRQ
ncbi:hypothetical protein D3C80_2011120 [compost metagenome]